jgi:hypothetical protein
VKEGKREKEGRNKEERREKEGGKKGDIWKKERKKGKREK